MRVKVRFAGHTEQYEDEDGVTRTRWEHGWEVIGIPYNYMVPGYRTGNVNTLRLWSARATQAFDLQVFNSGDYLQAVRAQAFAENISKVLYPEDSTPQGKELRLQQQYFFVACSLRDYIDNILPPGFDLRELPERVIFQLNDTHPVIAIPELMRILVDERGIDWDEAWDISRQCFAYTCHTLLPEALEVWPVDLLGRLLPRHLEIIYRINEEFLAELREAYPDDELRVRRMSIIQEHPERAVRMAYLATVGGSKVNGVAELHSQLLRDKVLSDFSDHWPEKFTNVTNGVTPRRFIALANPGLSGADHRHHRRRLAQRPGPAAGTRAATPRTRVPGRLRRHQGGQQGPARDPAANAGTASPCRPRRPVRRDGQAVARVQAADAEAAAHHHAVPADPAEPGHRPGARGWRFSAPRRRPATGSPRTPSR